MKYHFTDIQNGQIAAGYTVLQIANHEAEIANDDAEAILLAEKSGGQLVEPPAKTKATKTEPKGETTL